MGGKAGAHHSAAVCLRRSPGFAACAASTAAGASLPKMPLLLASCSGSGCAGRAAASRAFRLLAAPASALPGWPHVGLLLASSCSPYATVPAAVSGLAVPPPPPPLLTAWRLLEGGGAAAASPLSLLTCRARLRRLCRFSRLARQERLVPSKHDTASSFVHCWQKRSRAPWLPGMVSALACSSEGKWV